MDEIVRTVQSPTWWVTVAVAGVLINLVSVLLVRGLGSLGARMSARLERRSMAAKAKHEKEVARLRGHAEYRDQARAVALFEAAIAVAVIVLGATLTIVGAITASALFDTWLTWLLLAVGALAPLIAFMQFRTGYVRVRNVAEAMMELSDDSSRAAGGTDEPT